MAGYSIGLSGLDVARRAIEVIGNNIANAATDGYHRQEAVIHPLQSDAASGLQIGTGARVVEVRRVMDALLEKAIQRQLPDLGQVSQELVSLEALESLLGDLAGEGLGTALDNFFGAMQELASQPDSSPLRTQVVWAADALAIQFRSIARALDDLQAQVVAEARTLADQVNGLAREIADANVALEHLHGRGASDASLLDLRDRAVAQLAELADTEVQPQADGSYSVYVWGTCIVSHGQVTEIEADYAEGLDLGISVAGASHFDTTLRGGRLGAMLALKNDLLPAVADTLDDLATEVIDRINQIHVQGIGTAGSFTELTGWAVSTAPVGQWNDAVSAGTISLRLINTATGEVTRRTVTITAPSTQTLTDIAALFNAVPNLSATVFEGRLRLEAAAGYTFDFLPALTSDPASSTLTGTSTPTVSGLYTGSANQVYTCTVVGTGDVGVTSGLGIEVRNGAGELVRTMNVGQGYAAEDLLDVDAGIQVALSLGTLNAGETFTVQALADTDPTGLLSAAGLNTFFTGDSARSIRVEAAVLADPSRLATGLGAGDVDNLNVTRMAAVGTTTIQALGNRTLSDAYRDVATRVGQWVAVRSARQQGLENVLHELGRQRDGLSGVDINDEAAKLLVFQRMFQAMARFIGALDEAMQTLIEAI